MTAPTPTPEPIQRRDDELRLLAIGVDQTASIELREKVAYSPGEAEELLGRLVETDEILEACLLSTCNRTELYLRPVDETAAYRTGLELAFLSRAPEIEEEGRFKVRRDMEAVRHLLEVASGLQSMVLGEPEILGQVKQATGLAETVGASGKVLKRLLRVAIIAGGRVRSETAIGAGAVSFGYAVVDLARNIFRQLGNCSVLMVGAGEISRQVARSFTERGVRELRVTNRSLARAEEFRETFTEATIVPFDERRDALPLADIVVATTGAPEPVIHRDDIVFAMKRRRRSRPMLLADLGVPRNIEPAAGKLESVFLQDIDSLEGLISRNLKRRREEVPKVQEILDRELGLFGEWHKNQAVEPIVARLQKKAERLRKKELEAVLDRFPADTHGELEKLTRSLIRKLLHHPSAQLRRGHIIDPDRVGLVRDLFQLDED